MPAFGKYKGGASFDNEIKKKQSQPTVFQQKRAEEKEKSYQQTKNVTGMSRTAYNKLKSSGSKSASSSSGSSKKSSGSKPASSSSGGLRPDSSRFSPSGASFNSHYSSTVDSYNSGYNIFRQKAAAEKEKRYQQAKNVSGISRAAYEAVQQQKAAESIRRPSVSKRIGANALGAASSMYRTVMALPKMIADIPAALDQEINRVMPARREAHDSLKKSIDSNIKNKTLNALAHAATGTAAEYDDEVNALNAASKWLNWADKNHEKNLQHQQDVNYRADITGSKLSRGMQDKFGMGLNQAAGSTVNSAGYMAGLAVSGKIIGAVLKLGGAAAGLVSSASKGGNIISRVTTNTAKDPQSIAAAAASLPEFLKDARASLRKRKAKQGRKYTYADDVIAVTTAYLQAAINAGVETGGGAGSGLEAMTSKKLKDLVIGSLEEGSEEVVQGIVDRYAKNMLSGKTSTDDMVSIKNDEAVINPLAIGREGALGALGGAVFGGSRVLGSKVLDTAADVNDTYKAGKAINKVGAAAEVVAAGLQSGENRAAKKYADKLAPKLKVNEDGNATGLSNWQAGRQHMKNLESIAEDAALARAVRDSAGAEVAVRSDMPSWDNGSVNLKTRDISVSDKADTAFADTVKHETTHLAERYAPEQYKDYEKNIINAALQNDAAAVEQRRQRLLELGYSSAEVDSELAAELAAPLLNNRAAIERLARSKPSFSEKMADVVASAAAHVKNLSGKKYVTDNGITLTYPQMQRAEFLWRDAVRKSGGVEVDGGEAVRKSGTAPTPGDDIRHLFKQPPEYEIVDTFYRDVKNGRMDGIDNADLPKSQLRQRIREGKQLARAALTSSDEDVLNAAWQHFKSIAEDIAKNSYMYTSADADVYYEAKRQLMGHRIYVPDSEKTGELGESYNLFRKKNFGSLLFTSNPKDSYISDVYTDMRADYPQYFPDVVGDNERLQVMVDFMRQNPNAKRERMMSDEDVDVIAKDLYMIVGEIALNEMQAAAPQRTKSQSVGDDAKLNDRQKEISQRKIDNFRRIKENSIHNQQAPQIIQNEIPEADSGRMESQSVGDDKVTHDNVPKFSDAPPEIGQQILGKQSELDNQGVIRRGGTEAKRYVDGLVKEKGVESPSELAPGTVTRAQSKTDMRRSHSFSARARDLMSRAYTAVVDDMHPFWNYTQTAEKALGKKRFGADNPYKLAINSKDASSRAAYIITDKLVDYDNREIGSGLIETLEKNGITGDNYTDFNAYLVARHALEWLDPEAHGAVKQVYEQPELNDMDVVQAMIDDFEHKNPDFKKAAEKLYNWQRTMLKCWLLDTGLISQAQYDKFTEMYPNYVPFFRERDTSLGSVPAGGFANQDDIFKEAVGSQRRIYDPVENIMYNVASYVNHASKHGVTMAAVRLYDMLNDDPEHNILRQYWEEVEPVNPESDNPKYFKTKTKPDTAEQPSAAPVTWDSLADVTQEKENSISQTLREQMTVNDGIVTVMDGGNKRYFRVDDPALLSLLDNARPGRFDGFLALMASFSRVRAALITSFNPAFSLASNPIRDLGTLVLNSSDINKAKVIGRAAASYVDIAKHSQAYKSYLSMGGQYSSVTTEGTNAMKKAMDKLSAKDPNTVKRVFKSISSAPSKVFGAYQTFGDAIEASPRLAEFKSTLNKGYDYHEAFYRAKDVTTNFSRGGKISKQLNAVSNFFNAAVQGVDKFFRQGKNNTASFAAGIAVLTALEVASWAWNTWNPFKDKDDSFENLSNYTKNNFYTFYKGAGKFMSIPKPRESALLSSIIGASLQRYLNKQPERFRKFFSDYVIDQFMPDGSIAGYSTIQDLRANKDFMGRPIVPDNMAELPPELQYDDSTSYLARWLADMVHKLPDNIRDDLIESPMQIDHIINSEFGVLGKINRTYFSPKKDKWGKLTFGVNTTYSKDSLFSTDNLNIFYDNKNHAAAQAKGYPSSENTWLSNRYKQASEVLTVINKIYKNNPDGENARAVRLKYVNYAKQYKDNPLGYSDEVYNELKTLADIIDDDTILSLPQVKDTIEKTVDKKKISYKFDNAQSVLNYQADLNEAVDREFRKLFAQVEFNALSADEKLGKIKQAKAEASKAVKDFYIDNKGGKRMFDESSAAKPAFVKPAAEAVTQYQEHQAFMNSVNTDKLAPIAEALAKAVPDKAESYTAESFKYSEVDSKSFSGKKYKISGDLKEKINSEAENEYYSNIDKLLNNQINVEDVVGLTGKGKIRTSENAAGDKVSLSGKMYNADGSPRFDELVTAKIIKAAESNIKDVVLQRYKDEIIAGEAAAATPTAAPEATDAPATTAAPEGQRVFGKVDTGGSSNTLAAAFKAEMDNQRRKFGLPDMQPQRIVFGSAPPIGKTAAPAAATVAVTAPAPAPASGGSSRSRKRSGGSSRKRSGGSSSRRSSGGGSGRSSGGYASPALVSAAAQAYSGSASAAPATSSYASAVPATSYSPSRNYSADITAAIRQRYNDNYYTPFVINRVKIEDIIPDLIVVRQNDGTLSRVVGYYDELSPEVQQLLLDALQKRAEEEVVGTMV